MAGYRKLASFRRLLLQPTVLRLWESRRISGRHALRYDFRIMGAKLAVSLRTFRTDPLKRSRRYKQYVIRLPYSRYREVSLIYKGSHRRKSLELARYAPGLLIFLGIAGSIFFGFHVTTSRPIHPINSFKPMKVAAEAPPITKSLSRSTPTAITIPKIDLATELTSVDLNADGTLQVPEDPSLAGWYDKSPTPGEVGPAVIDGHVDYVTGIAVFWRLRELTAGDEIDVARADGSTARFSVDYIKEYPQESFDSKAVYGNIDYAGIRLITCSGTFNTETHHYSDNMVIFGHLL